MASAAAPAYMSSRSRRRDLRRGATAASLSNESIGGQSLTGWGGSRALAGRLEDAYCRPVTPRATQPRSPRWRHLLALALATAGLLALATATALAAPGDIQRATASTTGGDPD